MRRFAPFMDLSSYSPKHLSADALASISVVLLAIPQGVAYAMIAGLPPAMGLYACGIPVVIGCLFRSSRHVVTGPTNALSLLVAGALFSSTVDDPIQAAITLAFLVGVFQVLFGVLRLGGIVDYISGPVVLGYVVGAGVLIGVGQLPNASNVSGPRTGNLFERVIDWLGKLDQVDWNAVLLAVATIFVMAAIRYIRPKVPAGLFAVTLLTIVASLLGWVEQGLVTIADVAIVPTDWILWSAPSVALWADLLPLAIACTVLSSVESAAVGRSIASQSGQSLDSNTEFFGQGLANIAASFTSGYPISGSLGRSNLNARSGAQSRLSGVFSGLAVTIALPILAPLVNQVPIAVLAGLILVVAADLIQFRRIRRIFKGPRSDSLAFTATLLGTWLFDLDIAIYIGVGISLVLFLRRVRLVHVKELVVTEERRLLESEIGDRRACPAIRILHIEGNLFFGSAGELRNALEEIRLEQNVRVIVVRLKRTRGLDGTSATVLTEVATRMRTNGQRLILVGLKELEMGWLQASGALDELGAENVFPTRKEWFAAMNASLAAANVHVGSHQCDNCPVDEYLQKGVQ